MMAQKEKFTLLQVSQALDTQIHTVRCWVQKGFILPGAADDVSTRQGHPMRVGRDTIAKWSVFAQLAKLGCPLSVASLAVLKINWDIFDIIKYPNIRVIMLISENIKILRADELSAFEILSNFDSRGGRIIDITPALKFAVQ